MTGTSDGREEAIDPLEATIRHLHALDAIEAWERAFCAGQATLDDYPHEAWKEAYFGSRQGQGGQVFITTSGWGNNTWIKRYYEEGAQREGEPAPFVWKLWKREKVFRQIDGHQVWVSSRSNSNLDVFHVEHLDEDTIKVTCPDKKCGESFVVDRKWLKGRLFFPNPESLKKDAPRVWLYESSSCPWCYKTAYRYPEGEGLTDDDFE